MARKTILLTVMLMTSQISCENKPTRVRSNPIDISPHPDCKPSQCMESAQPAGDTCQIIYKSKGSECDDGNPKTKNDICNGVGLCEGRAAVTPPKSDPVETSDNDKVSDPADKVDSIDTTEKPETSEKPLPTDCVPGLCETTSIVAGNECKVTMAEAGTPCNDGQVSSMNDRCDGAGNCSGQGSIPTSPAFACALVNHQAQTALAPNYPYAKANGEYARNAQRQPLRLNWEPILEEVADCNGLPWTADAVDRELVEFSFFVALDASWVRFYQANRMHFQTQGYPTLESSPRMLFDRVSYLYEHQFRVRVSISRVESFAQLGEKCATNNGYAENAERDNTHTFKALEDRGITLESSEAGVVRIGVGSDSVYCHSYAPIASVCNSQGLIVNQVAPFNERGELNHRASVTLAHELGHYFGICGSPDNPYCLNAHLANEVPDIMVWDGTPATNVRPIGMFFKFMNSCTRVYKDLLCEEVKTKAPICGKQLTCNNGGLDCTSLYWTTRGSPQATSIKKEVYPRGARLAVRCCSDDPANLSCQSNDLGGVASIGNDQGCSGLMTWPEADEFCRQAGMRLCEVDELESTSSNLCANTSCAYDKQRVWTSSPNI